MVDNTQTNHSTDLMAEIQSINPQFNFNRIAQQFLKLIEMPKKTKTSTPPRVRFDGEPQQTTSQTQTFGIPKTNGTRTRDSSNPAIPSEIYAHALNFARSKIFIKRLLACLTTKHAILKEVRHCVLTGNGERCKQLSPRVPSFARFTREVGLCVP